MKIQITEEEKHFKDVWEFLRYVKIQYHVDDEMRVTTDDVNETITISIDADLRTPEEKNIPDEEIPF